MKLVSFLILHVNSTFSGVRCACVDVVLLIVGCCRNALKFNKFSLDGSFVYFLFFLFFWQVKKRFRKHQKNHSIALHELKQTTKRTNTHPHASTRVRTRKCDENEHAHASTASFTMCSKWCSFPVDPSCV